MDAILLEHWTLRADVARRSAIVPDGCRDLIFVSAPGERPAWHVSGLDASTRHVEVDAGSHLVGFRLRPGVRIDEERLLAAVDGRTPDASEIGARIDSFCRVSREARDALEALARVDASVEATASDLGVSTRTLQRLVFGETGRPPAFWRQLARVRGAARAIDRSDSLAELAFTHGFSDQAHMTREFRRWLAVSPTELRRTDALRVVLDLPGYP